MNGLEYIQRKQFAWAKGKCLVPLGSTFQNEGEENYLENVNDNVFGALTDETLKQLSRGAGGETKDYWKNGKHYRPKINALHSSSALVVNMFQYWHNKDVLPILHACKQCLISREFSTNQIGFEEKFVISDDAETFRFPPNIDVVIDDTQQIYAIESKFTEPYNRRRPKDRKGIRKEYLELESGFWNGLPNLYDLAKKICPVCPDDEFRYLDAAQLIKHTLGLKKRGKNFRLLYLWYDVIGQEGAEHRKEIERFAEIAKNDIQFSHITYQEVIMRMTQKVYDGNEEYCNYMTDRYL
jgi:hypothetical protein